MKINNYIDHTLLKQTATNKEIKELCLEAIKYDFATVCVNPTQIELAKQTLKGSNVGITTVIGFPLGATLTSVKAFETKEALNRGANEIDMVVNIGAVKDGNWDLVLEDIKEVKKQAPNNIVKVILETCLLTYEEIIKVCELALESGVEYVKTSTGFSTQGATFEVVKLMLSVVKGRAKVKAAGGVKTYEDAKKMIDLGVSRIGTSSGVKIIEGISIENNSY
ncbi:deoxyribose-phosphate aldolase [Spiroplasma apis]|uniref:Deoxyribose-phosphate aldolase n=1 Tax=Spiroplasma apis B31 TaxID=1276258 RepID=V5RKP9_SPIAP|nr:deoxyribose-phosphate aldolase [Spiroplasma apis]AHB36390.1 deoxyribose-phosphate aldolase [Spiroplasma apis B31]